MSIGTHIVQVAALGTGGLPAGLLVDITCLVDEAGIVHGRSDTTSQPDPSALTLEVTVSPAEPLPAVVDIGAWVTVDTMIGAAPFRRFTGRITDVDIGWDDAGELTPYAGVGRIVAVSVLSDYARSVIGSEPFPRELDGARVARIFAAAGLTLEDSSPGTVEVIARDVDARGALEVAHGTADSAGGLVWETTAGQIRYADAEYRRAAPVAMALDACDILVTPTWNRTLSGLVNEVTMSYGAATDPAPAPVHLTNEPSQDRWGRYSYSVTTELATATDANAAAGLILAQNAGPVWMLAALPVDVKSLSDADTAALLSLDVHSLIRVDDLPVTGPTPTTVSAWVEGWTEKLTAGAHDLELTVSDYCRTAPPPRWDDAPAGLSWDEVPAGVTWDDWSCWGPDGTP